MIIMVLVAICDLNGLDKDCLKAAEILHIVDTDHILLKHSRLKVKHHGMTQSVGNMFEQL